MNKQQWIIFLRYVGRGYGFAVFRHNMLVHEKWQRMREFMDSDPQ